ncbi:hypothetical protein [Microbacterium sp. 4R-513]|nr:hypothetical protein [Microbacterium sp. 4R-513]
MDVEQALLYGVTIIALAGTLIVFVVQLVRMNRRDKDGDGD